MSVALDNVSLIREGYDRFAAGDVEGVFALFSPELEWTIPGPAAIAGVYKGHEQVGGFFAKLPTLWEQEVRPRELLGDGDRVIVLGEHRIRRNGRDSTVPFAHEWTVENGLATAFYEYTDTAKFEQILGS
jgi:uncharacterized protein